MRPPGWCLRRHLRPRIGQDPGNVRQGQEEGHVLVGCLYFRASGHRRGEVEVRRGEGARCLEVADSGPGAQAGDGGEHDQAKEQRE
ncbi:MAG TPA: hypothetical protein VGW38_28425 [Chloroflexota bacterium]|nr:hypothetical protein [Chloroflexota bacterium]